MTNRLPPWIRMSLRTDLEFTKVDQLVNDLGLNTVCTSAGCPNKHECWNRGTATFMILGDTCTRDCRFCAVNSGKPSEIDSTEPERVAQAVARMALRYVVLTSVTRDDLADGGAQAFADTINAVRSAMPSARIEVLTPDFGGQESSVETVWQARPDVFGHNLETVRRLQPLVRPSASYERSLDVLRIAAARGAMVKSSLMLGLGETGDEVVEAMTDLRSAGCRLLAIGQYLSPSRNSWPVAAFIEPREFEKIEATAYELGFDGVAAGPLVRSSYKADELLAAGSRPA